MKKIVFNACEYSYNTFREQHRIPSGNEDDQNDQEKDSYVIGDDTNRQMVFTIYAAKRTHYKRLVRYIKLND